MAIIEVKNVRNFIGGRWVHDGIELNIEKGEIVALVGGSGVGKTTLFRSILMLDPPTFGSINIFDVDVCCCTPEQARAVESKMGVLFQHSALFSSLTVLENVLFPIKEFTHLPEEVQKEIALLKISMTGLPIDSAVKYPSELSGGMMKRAALARAIALDPDLLFLDEPTTGLDPRSAGALDDLIVDLRDSLDLTIVMITHDLDSLWRTTDKVAFLGEGKVLAFDDIAEVMKNPHPIIKDYFSGPRGRRQYETRETRKRKNRIATLSNQDIFKR